MLGESLLSRFIRYSLRYLLGMLGWTSSNVILFIYSYLCKVIRLIADDDGSQFVSFGLPDAMMVESGDARDVRD